MTREEVASKVMKIVADLSGGEDIKEDMFLDTYCRSGRSFGS